MTEGTPIHIKKTQILCQQCTAVLPVEQGALIVVCEFCGVSNAVDKSEIVLHFTARQTVRKNDAAPALRRWMGSGVTVADLDKKARISQPDFQLWPLWQVRAIVKGEEKLFLNPAAAISVMDITQMVLPASDLEPFDYQTNAEVINPTVPLNAVKKWLTRNQKISEADIVETVLVHLPVYVFRYTFSKRTYTYTAVVDAATGRVFADTFPFGSTMPHRQTILKFTCIFFFLVAALLFTTGFFLGGDDGLMISLVVYLIMSVLMSIPIFMIIAAKILEEN